MNGLMVLLRKDVKEQMRSSQLLVALIVGVVFGILSPVTARYMPELIAMVGESESVQIIVGEPGYRDVVDQYISNLTQIGVFVAIFLTMGAIAKEKEQGTLAFLKVKPLSTTAIVVSKMLAALLTFSLSVVVSTALTAGYTQLLFGELPVAQFLRSGWWVLVYFWVMVILTIAVSAVVAKPAVAAVATLALWLVSGIVGGVPRIGGFMPTGVVTMAGAAAFGLPIDYRPLIGVAVMVVPLVAAAIRQVKRWE